MLNFEKYKVFGFDCYGTLIDWETGIVDAIRPILHRHDVDLNDEHILNMFGELESEIQKPPYKRYFNVLQQVLDGFGNRLGFQPTDAERSMFGSSVRNWPAFHDSTASLRILATHVDLVILSNVDDDLFASSAQKLGVDFHTVITAEQVGCYKPSLRNFEALIDRAGCPRDSILHVAQSLFHDIAPATEMGLDTVWVNRRIGKAGGGATPPQHATADLEVPDMQTLADMVNRACEDRLT